jgi:hypothetical protein
MAILLGWLQENLKKDNQRRMELSERTGGAMIMNMWDFRRTAILIVALVLADRSALAATATGPNALALAALVAGESPQLIWRERRVMRRLFRGQASVHFPPNKQISIKADAISCRVSNVDITSRSCKLTFGGKSVDVTGRVAHALFATIALVGVPPDGAAGSVFESLSKLVCTIYPSVIAQKAGGGAECTFDPGTP